MSTENGEDSALSNYSAPVTTNAMTRASCGLIQYDVTDLNNAIGVANASGFDFFVGPLTHPLYKLYEVR